MSSTNPFLNQPPPKRGPSCLLITLAILGGGAALLALACCGGLAYLARPPVASATAEQPFSLDDVPLPASPARGLMNQLDPQVAVQEFLRSGGSDGYYRVPGQGGKLILYLPTGQYPPASLPCILITGAGSNLLEGMLLGEGDNPEHLPYVKAGYAVVAYELDGPGGGSDADSMRKAYEAFRASRAGLINARNALQFVLDRVPEVNPSQIYAAGHSSAATHALLFAEHEPRLAGVIAYAPAVSVSQRFGPALRGLAFALPGVVDFATQSSPHTHRQQLKCATFLFHAEDDNNCPIARTREFAEQLKQQGTDVALVTFARGGHYESMINEGIPAGIKWLRQRERPK